MWPSCAPIKDVRFIYVHRMLPVLCYFHQSEPNESIKPALNDFFNQAPISQLPEFAYVTLDSCRMYVFKSRALG